ncbi:hypothetical protein [Actinopolyspora mortivallis]|uniref:Ferric siderophore reductase C-terminal domain-containing protein n=1 Tax=Actinopolyspora mortivallis TaxID=33906 RepID=A0A2T0GWU0_ACTMO|nr:hypothetical protein [Actinopolyspora mortivallis]PRW63579.1 hypothetical protein CEP50_09675 [Actinopolyspora mortivallis]
MESDSDPNPLTAGTRALARPGRTTTETRTVPWERFCDPEQPYLADNVRHWQRRAGFEHHRAGTVLVAFRACWLMLCATIPEYHLGTDFPSARGTRAVVTPDGFLHGLLPGPAVRTGTDEDRAVRWWTEVSALVTPLTRGLAGIGGPPADSDQYWGNAVGLIGEVLRRADRDGIGGDTLASALTLRAATGREDLVRVTATPEGLWTRRRTCCQMWRSGTGYCTECVLHDSPARG